MKKKLNLLIMVIVVLLLSTSNIYAIDEKNYKINEPINKETIIIKSYGTTTYLNNIGTNRGNLHTREVIPYTLKAGETITLKQIKEVSSVDFVAELKSGFQANDVSATVKKDGSKIGLTALDESVIYIRVPRSNYKDVTIEYSITKATSLPIFIQNETNEKDFFEQWDFLKTKNAVIGNEVVLLQIPEMNKEYLRDLKVQNNFNNINHVLQYYREMIDFYDYSYGLDGSTYYNENPSQRYLAVPELRNTGAVGIYETHIVRAFGSLRGMRVMLDDAWLSKHEFAHGYQGHMMDNDVSVREIWNNIPSHYYAMITNSNNTSYRINYTQNLKADNQKNVYEKSVQIRKGNANTAYNLEFFREIFDQFGIEVFVKFNQDYRKLGLTGEHSNKSNTNRFAEYFSKHATVDLVPYFLSYGFNVDNEVMENNSYLPKAYYLVELVNNQEKINYIMEKYNLVTKYSLVDTSIFSTDPNLSSLKGNLTINVNIDDDKELIGKQMMIKNGKLEYYAEIKNGKAIFTNISVGTYEIFPPLTNNGLYKKELNYYMNISENSNATTDVSYNEIKDNYANLNYDFIIYSDYYTTLISNLKFISDNNYQYTVNVLGGRSNSGANTLYGYLKVYDDKDNILIDHEFFNRTPSVSSTQTITLKKGYKIYLYRANRLNRRKFTNTLTNMDFYDTVNPLIIFTIGDKGIECDICEDSSKTALQFLESSSYEKLENSNQYFNSINRIYFSSALNYLNEDDKKTFFDNHAKGVQYFRMNNPEISLKQNIIEIKIGQQINYNNYVSANDIEDGDLSNKITFDTSLVDVSKEGLYSVSIRVEDRDHNYSTDSIIVNVTKQENNSNIIDGNDENDVVDKDNDSQNIEKPINETNKDDSNTEKENNDELDNKDNSNTEKENNNKLDNKDNLDLDNKDKNDINSKPFKNNIDYNSYILICLLQKLVFIFIKLFIIPKYFKKGLKNK
ncbi:MAG: hypothetical protein ACK5HL_04810 [Bacilli bacterium]